MESTQDSSFYYPNFNRGNDRANSPASDFIGLSDDARRDGETICLSAGTKSDNPYYYDNYVVMCASSRMGKRIGLDFTIKFYALSSGAAR